MLIFSKSFLLSNPHQIYLFYCSEDINYIPIKIIIQPFSSYFVFIDNYHHLFSLNSISRPKK